MKKYDNSFLSQTVCIFPHQADRLTRVEERTGRISVAPSPLPTLATRESENAN
jgi:hypothetical protein